MTTDPAGQPALIRRRLDLRGQVQGVGFRPYVYRLATQHALAGLVANNSRGALIEVEGPPAAVDAFEHDLLTQLPPLARIADLTRRNLPLTGARGFHIQPSEADPNERPEVTPDAATCTDCRRELLDPADRRHRYPFINCTNCGPRYSIIRGTPYDRPKTTMAAFTMCPRCAAEYADPADRRFHAQPNACAECGPQVRLMRVPPTASDPRADEAVRQAARLLQDGRILAVKGIGGYHLACRADRQDVVERLRQRKLRDGKPLAVMVPDLAAAQRLCRLSSADVAALTSPAAPIVLAPQVPDHGLAPAVAPGCRDLGIMLPYAPLHHLLFAEGLGPLVMTSANLSGQPLTYRDDDARAELADVADAFVVHDREIHRPIDDSVVYTFRDEAVPIRRARGYAPRPLHVALPAKGPRVLAVGGELKSVVCLLDGGQAILSEHLGDLTNPAAYRHFVQAIDRLKELCGFEPTVVACDLHPRYMATEYAQRLGLPLVAVQHHHAHIASVMAEWGDVGPVIGLSCDGTGYGTDGAVWGCEILRCERGTFERLGHLEYFPLVGGDVAALETWRPAAALLRAACGADWPRYVSPPATSASLPGAAELRVFARQARTGTNAPPTSSLGRVFDAVACLLGLCHTNRHEAEAAMAVEAAAALAGPDIPALPHEITAAPDGLVMSVLPLVRELVAARDRGVAPANLAAAVHESVARLLADSAERAAEPAGIRTVGLSGGCFANRRLLQRLVDLLEQRGFRVLYHRHVPCGDGGLALGQALVAAWSAGSPPRD